MMPASLRRARFQNTARAAASWNIIESRSTQAGILDDCGVWLAEEPEVSPTSRQRLSGELPRGNCLRLRLAFYRHCCESPSLAPKICLDRQGSLHPRLTESSSSPGAALLMHRERRCGQYYWILTTTASGMFSSPLIQALA